MEDVCGAVQSEAVLCSALSFSGRPAQCLIARLTCAAYHDPMFSLSLAR